MNAFVLHLQGPMMSADDGGFGQLRSDGAFPSRSLVLGIIAAAKGIRRGSVELVRLHAAFRVHIAEVYAGTTLVDFHTVHSAAYEDESLCHHRGNLPGNPVLTTRLYRQDAHYIALCESDDSALFQGTLDALRRPSFVAYLGRRACPPARPLLPVACEGESNIDALISAVKTERKSLHKKGRVRWKMPVNDIVIYFDGEAPGDLPEGAQVVIRSQRRDRLVGITRTYAIRTVSQVIIPYQDPTDVKWMDRLSSEEVFDAIP